MGSEIGDVFGVSGGISAPAAAVTQPAGGIVDTSIPSRGPGLPQSADQQQLDTLAGLLPSISGGSGNPFQIPPTQVVTTQGGSSPSLLVLLMILAAIGLAVYWYQTHKKEAS